jgi:type III pantothenate kinase
MDVAPENLEACVASSVAPVIAHLVKRGCRTFLGRDVLFAPEDIAIPLQNKYERPQEVGADRLVGAYAARCLLPDAKSIISVDYGTATTFDFVTDDTYPRRPDLPRRVFVRGGSGLAHGETAAHRV